MLEIFLQIVKTTDCYGSFAVIILYHYRCKYEESCLCKKLLLLFVFYITEWEKTTHKELTENLKEAAVIIHAAIY